MAASLTPRLNGRIQPAKTGHVTEEHVPVLLWVHSGTATVDAAGVTYRLSAREAIWIPPGLAHCTQTDEGGVVLPIFPRLPELRGPLAEVRVILVPEGWEDWLVFQFDFNNYHSFEANVGSQALVSLLTDSPAPSNRGPLGASVPLPLPRSPEGRAVAQALLRSPGSPRTIDTFAARENVSARTLQRQFRDETGIAFSEWRTRARIAVAANHLSGGRGIGWTGRRVGYGTPAGFTRAFQRHLEMTPHGYVLRSRALGREAHGSVEEVSALVAAEPREPPHIPARHVWSWVYDHHVLWWTYRGRVAIRIGTRNFTLRQGDAIWLPAGFTASVDLTKGSIFLPLGNRYGGAHIGVDELNVFSLPEDAEGYLLHTLLAEYTLFRPGTGELGISDQLFREQFVSGRGSAAVSELTGAVSAIARELRSHPADRRSLADWARRLRLSPQKVSREFITQTGSSFPRWRAKLRMSLARELLMLQDPLHKVSEILGYATPATFSKVFTSAHGISPRKYQHQISKQLD